MMMAGGLILSADSAVLGVGGDMGVSDMFIRTAALAEMAGLVDLMDMPFCATLLRADSVFSR